MQHTSKPAYSYLPLSREGIDESEKDFHQRASPRCADLTRGITAAIILGVLLALSLGANVVLLCQRRPSPARSHGDRSTSKFAGLRYNKDVIIEQDASFNHPNRTIQDAAWESVDMNTYWLFVALDDDYVAEQGLPHAQRWPWDESKGVYIPTAAHELHCVKALRHIVHDLHDGVPVGERAYPYSHADHCLNLLRQSVMCKADDYPLYTGLVHANVHTDHPSPGNGVTKRCRDWGALIKWAHERSACYESIHRHDAGFPEIERYKSCPDGSEPWKKSYEAVP